ncbi:MULTISPECIES: hypothetical protein [Bacillaceae]|uniref:hypothetical protein n=1 Tax=Bacillaceae TaxID=186817 RepID=UPI0005A7F4D0|nr:hypothetical protein [Bacillus rubiinfantis]
MIQLMVALLHFVAGGIGVALMMGGEYIPSPKLIMLAGSALTLVYYAASFVTKGRSKKIRRLLVFSLTVYISLLLSSYLYSAWTFDKIFSAAMMMKAILFMLLLLSTYGNFLYMRAESSYKKKRGNQRIKEPAQESMYEKWKNRKQEPKQEVMIVLGESTENGE